VESLQWRSFTDQETLKIALDGFLKQLDGAVASPAGVSDSVRSVQSLASQ